MGGRGIHWENYATNQPEKKKGNFTKTADLTLSLLTGAFDVGLLDGLGCWGCWDYEIHSRGSFPKIPYV
jgi:hypothetical protein